MFALSLPSALRRPCGCPAMPALAVATSALLSLNTHAQQTLTLNRFLTTTGDLFSITPYGATGQLRYLCRLILETYRKVFRYAELEGTTALLVRRTFVARLHDRGADEDQIGMVLGIGERRAVRKQFPRTRPTMARLVQELA